MLLNLYEYGALLREESVAPELFCTLILSFGEIRTVYILGLGMHLGYLGIVTPIHLDILLDCTE